MKTTGIFLCLMVSLISNVQAASTDLNKRINVVCVDSSCFNKVEEMYKAKGCELNLIRSENIDHERSFVEISALRTYVLVGCTKATIDRYNDVRNVKGTDEASKICPKGHELKKLTSEENPKMICLEGSATRRARLKTEEKKPPVPADPTKTFN